VSGSAAPALALRGRSLLPDDSCAATSSFVVVHSSWGYDAIATHSALGVRSPRQYVPTVLWTGGPPLS
jgi:hypothetical protein